MLPIPRPLTDRRARAAAVAFLAVLAALACLAGCGGKKADDGVLLAVVGDTEIRSGYYEDRLRRLAEDELPRDERNRPLDMAAPEGKSEFLTTLINKELMVRKATQMGYAADPRISGAREAVHAYEAATAMWNDVLYEPSNSVSNEEVDAIYSNLGRQRTISFVITNLRADAEAARAMALEGAAWEDVVSRFHDGDVPPDGDLQLVIPYGRYDPDFEGPVFAVEIGGITEPVETKTGWWVIRVDAEKQGSRPKLDDTLAAILDLIRNRKIAGQREAFQQQMHEMYKLKIDDAALLKCWEGLPEMEQIIDPETNQPVPNDQLKDLELAPADLDMFFYSYEVNGEEHSYTLGDYKILFDRMNTFQRPKKGSMLGGLRGNIVEGIDRVLIAEEARRRGYYEDPEVVKKVNLRVEEMMVTTFYGEVVTVDDRATPEDLQAYWDENHAEFDVPEGRTGFLVIAADEAKAAEARAQAEAGTPWLRIVEQYGTDEANKRGSGKLTDVRATASGPVRDALFALAPGQLGEPFPLGDGRWGVVRLESVTPGREVTLTEVADLVSQRLRSDRKEQVFQDLLAKWAGEFGVERFDENLDQVKSWKELTHVEAPGPEVPRS